MHYSRPVIRDDGSVYPSLKDAALSVGKPNGYGNIANAIRRDRAVYGHKWDYAPLERNPVRTEWKWNLMLWWVHREVDAIDPRYRQDAFEHVWSHVAGNLSKYDGSVQQMTFVRKYAHYGLLRWLERWRERHILLDDRQWMLVSDIMPHDDRLQRLLDDMPDDMRRLCLARWGTSDTVARRELHMERGDYDALKESLRQWLRGRRE